MLNESNILKQYSCKESGHILSTDESIDVTNRYCIECGWNRPEVESISIGDEFMFHLPTIPYNWRETWYKYIIPGKLKPPYNTSIWQWLFWLF